jgi:hypothetical protein
MQHLFVEKMCKMDCSLMLVSGFRVYNRYFLSYNEKRGLIKTVPQSNGSPVCIALSTDLLGVENMWQMALRAENQLVSAKAIRALNQIHENVCVLYSAVLVECVFLLLLFLFFFSSTGLRFFFCPHFLFSLVDRLAYQTSCARFVAFSGECETAHRQSS